MKSFRKLSIIAGITFIAGAITLSIAYGFTVGNAIALCIGGTLVAFGVWFQRLPRRLQKAMITLAATGIACFLVVTTIIIVYGTRDTTTFDEDCVLVLGCGIRGETVLPTLQARLDKCLEYLARNPHVTIVVSGGQGSKEDITEAEAMKRYLTRNGISPAQTIMESQSRNTKENIVNSKQMLDTRFAGRKYTTVCITSDYHALRVRKTAREAGLDIRQYNASVKWYLRPSAYCREALSVCKYWIFG